MAESSKLYKTARSNKKNASESFYLYGSTPLNEKNDGRTTFPSGSRLRKITSTSLEKLSFISEKDSCINTDLENYDLEYSSYLLRKIQNKLLSDNYKEKEEGVKKCFVSLKWELEDLLKKFVNTSKEIAYFKEYLEVIKKSEEKVNVGKNVLQVLKENNFDNVLESLSNTLDYTINNLQLVDIDKSAFEELFEKKILGSGSEIEESLTKIHSNIGRNKEKVSEIASELSEIQKLYSEILILRERYFTQFNYLSDEIVETNYHKFVSPVINAFKKREELGLNNLESQEDLINVNEIFHPEFKPINPNFSGSLQISNIDSPYSAKPHSSSTPQPN